MFPWNFRSGSRNIRAFFEISNSVYVKLFRMKTIVEVDEQVRELSRGGNAAVRGVLFANMYIKGNFFFQKIKTVIKLKKKKSTHSIKRSVGSHSFWRCASEMPRRCSSVACVT